MNAIEEYIKARDEQVRHNGHNDVLWRRVHDFTADLVETNYAKNFTWMGIPILQYPSDLMVMQELIWKIEPVRIIETGIAFGGMSKFYADMMSAVWGPGSGYMVISIDIDIRPHALKVLRDNDIVRIQGSSTDMDTFRKVTNQLEEDAKRQDTLVSLDSNHTHAHVLRELELYAPLVSVGSYIVVFDTAIEFFGHLDKNRDQRPWGPGNSPYTAVQAFLKTDLGACFEVDRDVETRALITSAPGGFLKRLR